MDSTLRELVRQRTAEGARLKSKSTDRICCIMNDQSQLNALLSTVIFVLFLCFDVSWDFLGVCFYYYYYYYYYYYETLVIPSRLRTTTSSLRRFVILSFFQDVHRFSYYHIMFLEAYFLRQLNWVYLSIFFIHDSPVLSTVSWEQITTGRVIH